MKNSGNRVDVFEKFNGKCAYCGCEIALNEMQIDHIIPQRNFEKHILEGSDKIPQFLRHLNVSDLNHIDNLFPACRICNGWKSTYHLELFRSEIGVQVKRLNERSANFRMAKKYGLIEETENEVIFYFECIPNH